jgi:hypothetical protein
MEKPSCKEWIRIINQFLELQNFPNCIEAIDEKCIEYNVFPPPDPSNYYNHKNFYHFQAAADVDGKCIVAEIGDYSQSCDVTFSKNSASTSGISLTDRRIYITKSEKFPFVFVGEEAYIL